MAFQAVPVLHQKVKQVRFPEIDKRGVAGVLRWSFQSNLNIVFQGSTRLGARRGDWYLEIHFRTNIPKGVHMCSFHKQIGGPSAPRLSRHGHNRTCSATPRVFWGFWGRGSTSLYHPHPPPLCCSSALQLGVCQQVSISTNTFWSLQTKFSRLRSPRIAVFATAGLNGRSFCRIRQDYSNYSYIIFWLIKASVTLI